MKCLIADRRIKSVSLLPAWIAPSSELEMLAATDGRFERVVGYLEGITREQGLDARCVRDGDRVVIG